MARRHKSRQKRVKRRTRKSRLSRKHRTARRECKRYGGRWRKDINVCEDILLHSRTKKLRGGG